MTQVNFKMAKTKKSTIKKMLDKEPKTKEEWEIKILKQKIEQAKTGFDRYVETILRHSFIESCTGGPYFNEMFLKLMKHAYNKVRESDLPKEQKDKIENKWFADIMIGNPSATEKEKIEYNLKYHERLLSGAKHELEHLNEDLKKKIIIDSIEQRNLWLEQFNKNDKLYKALDEAAKLNKTKLNKTKLKKIK